MNHKIYDADSITVLKVIGFTRMIFSGMFDKTKYNAMSENIAAAQNNDLIVQIVSAVGCGGGINIFR